MTNWDRKATAALRSKQENDEVFGGLFAALHLFADRTAERFFEDAPELPHPVLAMEPDRMNRKGFYTTVDGYTLSHRINLNPMVLRTGEEAAEVLAHEMVHLWQAHVGKPIKRNYHGHDFHVRMRQYGIETDGKRGDHVRYFDPTWPNWLVENEDLSLAKWVLPGSDRKKPRTMTKHMCPDCGASFRCRLTLRVLCLDCSVPFEVDGEDDSEEE